MTCHYDATVARAFTAKTWLHPYPSEQVQLQPSPVKEQSKIPSLAFTAAVRVVAEHHLMTTSSYVLL